MQQRKNDWSRWIILVLFTLGFSFVSRGQSAIVSLATVDGMDITPDNIFSFQVTSLGKTPTNVIIKGTIRYRQSNLRIGYSFQYTLQPGNNLVSASLVHPSWEFSSSGLRELFLDYKVLPQGTYEYCVSILPDHQGSEPAQSGENTDCLYRKSEDLFMINLIDPDNNAKIYEYYPLLSWVVTYPFASALTYRVRVAEIKQGQNTTNAINRNNPIYEEKNIMQPGIVYPVYAKPLRVLQPYAWTVDAYYKGILLGGAEPWKFTIIEDSLLQAVPHDPGFIELNIEKGTSVLYAVGALKLKYVEREQRTNTLHFLLTDESGKSIKLPDTSWSVNRGDNRKILQLFDAMNLRHWKNYRLTVTTENGHSYIVPFRYVNPIYLKQ